MRLEAGQAKLEAGQNRLENRMDNLETGQAAITKDIADLKKDQNYLGRESTEIITALVRIENHLKEFKMDHNKDFEKAYSVMMDIDEKVERNHKEIACKLNAHLRITHRNTEDIALLQEAVNL